MAEQGTGAPGDGDTQQHCPCTGPGPAFCPAAGLGLTLSTFLGRVSKADLASGWGQPPGLAALAGAALGLAATPGAPQAAGSCGGQQRDVLMLANNVPFVLPPRPAPGGPAGLGLMFQVSAQMGTS